MPSGEEGARIREAFGAIWSRARPGETYVYPPTLFEAEFGRAVSAIGTDLVNLAADMPYRVFGNDIEGWLDYLGVPAAERSILSSAYNNLHLRSTAAIFARPDILLSDSGLKAVEVNFGGPIGGITGHDPYLDAFVSSGLNDRLERLGYRLEVPRMTEPWLAAFTGALRCDNERAHVYEAIADVTDPNLSRHFFTEMLESAGFDVSHGLVTDLRVADDGVTVDGRRVHVVFAMYTWYETCEFVPPGLTRQLIDLDSRGLVDFIGTPASALHDNKVNLELLTSSRFRHLLSDAERALVDGHLPATFRLLDETFGAAVENKDSLVCKPSSEFGGRGVLCGWTMDVADWRAALSSRVRESQTYVCQQRVTSVASYTTAAMGEPIDICFGPLVLGGRYGGSFTKELERRAGPVISGSAGCVPGAVLAVRRQLDHR